MSAHARTLRACDVRIELGGRPLLMGIVNASPDSFSDGGLHAGLEEVYGLSVQEPRYQRELALRLRLPYPLLSDPSLALRKALRLPIFEARAGWCVIRAMKVRTPI